MRIYLVIAISVLLSCNDNKGKEQSQPVDDTTKSQKLIGEWNNLYLNVKVDSKKNTAEQEELIVTREEWESKLKIKPIRTFFREDSTWNSAHYNLNDSLVYNPSGKWWVQGDSIVMLQTFPSPDTTLYFLTLKSDTASFESLLDWDGDGKKDDRYLGRQLKVNR